MRLNVLISGVFVAYGSNSMLLETHLGSDYATGTAAVRDKTRGQTGRTPISATKQPVNVPSVPRFPIARFPPCMSPAMAAGATDRLWSVEDLVALWESYEGRRAEKAA
jgi:hypothetical protein